MSDTQTAEVTSTRTYHASDYRRMARTIQRMRAVKGNPYQPKDEAHQAKIDLFAQTIALAFEVDAAGDPAGIPFSVAAFLAGTQLPTNPAYPSESVLLDSPPEDAGEEL